MEKKMQPEMLTHNSNTRYQLHQVVTQELQSRITQIQHLIRNTLLRNLPKRIIIMLQRHLLTKAILVHLVRNLLILVHLVRNLLILALQRSLPILVLQHSLPILALQCNQPTLVHQTCSRAILVLPQMHNLPTQVLNQLMQAHLIHNQVMLLGHNNRSQDTLEPSHNQATHNRLSLAPPIHNHHSKVLRLNLQLSLQGSLDQTLLVPLLLK